MSTTPPATRVRPEPRITVTKLGEYLVATPARRKTIIHDQREPSAFQTARYTDAERAITDYVVSGFDEAVLDRALGRLAAHEPRSDYDAQRVQLCVEALRSIRNVPLAAELDGATVFAAPPRAPTLTFAGVTVSVRPEMLLTFLGPKKQERRGALKLYFSKTHPLDERSGEYIGAVVHQHAVDYPASEAFLDHRRVLVVDVFGQKIYTAPRATAKRLKDVTAACEEIAIRWDSA